MSDTNDWVMLRKSEIEALRTYGDLDDMIMRHHLRAILDKATPCGEPAIVVHQVDSPYYTCMIKDLADLPEGTNLYTTPQVTETLNTLNQITAIAHCGGWVDMKEYEANVAIRKLTRHIFSNLDKTKSREEIIAMLTKAMKGQ